MQVADTAATDLRMLGIRPDVFAHVPATLALGMGQRSAFELVFGAAYEAGFRANEYKAQVVGERGENVVLFAIGVKDDFRLQRGANFSVGTKRFKCFGDFGAIAANLAPLVEQCGFVGQRR